MLWSKYLGYDKEHPSDFQMLGQLLRVTAFHSGEMEFVHLGDKRKPAQLFYNGNVHDITVGLSLRSWRLNSVQATGSSADQPPTHTAQAAGIMENLLVTQRQRGVFVSQLNLQP